VAKHFWIQIIDCSFKNATDKRLNRSRRGWNPGKRDSGGTVDAKFIG